MARGEERQGGRRRVIREALDELRSAWDVTSVMRESSAQEGAGFLDMMVAAGDGDVPLSSRAGAALLAPTGHELRSVASGPEMVARAIGALDMGALKTILSRKQMDDATRENRLQLMAAMNLIRTRALLKVTGRCVDSLMHCTNASAFTARDAAGAAGLHADVIDRFHDANIAVAWSHETPQLLPQMTESLPPLRVTNQGLLTSNMAPARNPTTQQAYQAIAQTRIEVGGDRLRHGVVAVTSFLSEPDPQWLLHAAAYAARDSEASQRRHRALHTFQLDRFRAEWNAMISSLFTPLVMLRNLGLYLLAWESPLLSAVVMTMLLALCWYDMLGYSLALFFFCNAWFVVVWDSLPPDLRERILRSLYRSEAYETRGLLESIRVFRTSLGTAQYRMSKLNIILSKMRSLYTWADPTRTRLFLVGLLCLTVFLCVVPARVWFAVFVLVQFTRPLRDPAAGLTLVAWNRFVDGLPVPSAATALATTLNQDQPSSHPGVVVYSLLSPVKQPAAGRRRV